MQNVYFSVLIIILSFTSCTNIDKQECEFLLNRSDTACLRKTIIDGIIKNDLPYISKIDSINENKLKSILFKYGKFDDSTNIFFDINVNGFLIKYYYFDKFELPFCIIKRPHNGFFYFSNSDKLRYSEIFPYKYFNGKLELLTADSLFFYHDVASIEAKLLKNIVIEEHKAIDKNSAISLCVSTERLIMNCYNHLYFNFSETSKSKAKLISIHDAKTELYFMYKSKDLDDAQVKNLQNILSKIQQIYSESFRTCMFKCDNLGIILFSFKYCNNTINIDKYFIPQLSRKLILKM